MRIHFYWAIIVVFIIVTQASCSTFNACTQPHLQGVPNCPPPAVKIEGCRIHA